MFRRPLECFLILLIPTVGIAAFRSKVGVLCGPEEDLRLYSDKFWSFFRDRYPGITLEPVIERLDWWGPLQITRAVCRLAENGATSFLALNPTRSSEILESFSDFLGLPLLTGRVFGTKSNPSPRRISFLPDTTQATADVLRNYGWNIFAFLYTSQDGADKLQDVLAGMDLEPRVDGFWRVTSAEDAYRIVSTIRQSQSGSNTLRLLLATSKRLANELATKLAGMPFNVHIVLMEPLGLLDQLTSHHGSVLLTTLSMVNSSDPFLPVLENRWKTMMPQGRRSPNLSDHVVFNHDAINILYAAYTQLDKEQPSYLRNVTARRINCSSESHNQGEDDLKLTSYIKQVSLERGLTGLINFDSNGRRTDYSFHVYETTPVSQRKIGSWSTRQGLKMLQKTDVRISDIAVSAALQDVPEFSVTSILNEPFLYQRDDKFEGYVVDLLDVLTVELGWRYNLHLVKDGRYGIIINGSWAGMVGEVVRKEADFAVAGLTKTNERGTVVDFSKTFLTIGLNILIKKPEYIMEDSNRLGAFSFLTVWSHQIWLLFLLMVVVFTLVSYALARFTGTPERIRALSTKESDRLSPCSSFWFVSGSLLLRETGIFPKSLSHRLSSILWWTFGLFFLMAYIASLTEHLIVSRNIVTTTHAQTTSHELLKKFLETGSPVVGTLTGGSTEAFFKYADSRTFFSEYGEYIQKHPEVLTKSYQAGTERVRSSGGNYAFIMESASSEFISNSEPCDTLATPGFLESKSYAVVMRKDSPYRDDIDHAILKLMERGTLRQLFEKWWYNYSSTCEDPNLDVLPRIYSNTLTLHEISGVFYIFVVFLLISVIVAAVESKRKKMSLRT